MEIKMPPTYKTQWLFLLSSFSLFDCTPPYNLDIPRDQPSGILWAQQGFWVQQLEPKLEGGKSLTCSWKRKKTKAAKYREEERVNEFLDAGECQIMKALLYKAAKMKQRYNYSSFTFKNILANCT